jgi:hypothetical protein
VIIAIATGCGGSSASKPSERELFEQTQATLEEKLHPTVGEYEEGHFPGPHGGTRTIYAIATGADAPAYEGYPWTVESPDGEVAIKSDASGGAFTEDCNQAIEEAMGW